MNQAAVDVVLPLPLATSYSYAVPDGSCQIGERVWVPFGNQSSMAWVVAEPTTEVALDFKLKPLEQLHDPMPIFSATQLELAHWISRYYLAALGEVLAMMSPGMLQKKSTQILLDDIAEVRLTAKGQQALLASHASAKQLQLLSMVQEHDDQCLTLASCRSQGFSRSTIAACQKREWLSFSDSNQSKEMKPQSYEQVQLRPEQQQAVEMVLQQLNGFSQFVLEGVTGSGKTEVYCPVIQQVLAQGKQALVLVPEIGLTPQTVARFVQRCGVKAVLMHSKLTEQQK